MAFCLYQIDASGPSINNMIVNNTIIQALPQADEAIPLHDNSTGNTVLNNIL